ncbi:MAG TPA: rRNA maturation RNase YbeY [Rubrobacteraceae bacterium]|nr:rRNA maturation RNase YbeY [Rubrobacteraceae bacterium]
MPFSVALLDEVSYGGLDAARVTDLCATAFSARGFDLERLGEVSVALVDPETIHELNREYRGVDRTTDVLSFEVDGPYGEMVGEVVIAPDCAHPEMGVEELVVHGALHLSGMDHGDQFEDTEMARVQAAVMESARERAG